MLCILQHTGSKTEKVENTKELERLLSGAVSQKNGNKANMQRSETKQVLTEEEKKRFAPGISEDWNETRGGKS